MGSKQSTATVTSPNGSTSSASNIPAGSATANRVRTLSVSTSNGARSRLLGTSDLHLGAIPSVDSRQRARSLSHVHNMSGTSNGSLTIGIPPLVSSSGIFDISGSPDSEGSNSPDESGGLSLGTSIFGNRVYAAHSLPSQLSAAFNGIKCPVCSKFVIPDDIEYHLVMCLTKPRISYNEDVLREDKGECVICLDDLQQGDTIARLPCLCIYHKSCIDSWFEVNRSCPEHPLD